MSARGKIGGRTAVRVIAPLAEEPRNVRGPPRSLVIAAIALAGCVAAAASFALSLGGDYGRAPYVHATIVAWITLAYVLCGLIAWWRRPESRFGPLLVAAGFAPTLSRLAELDSDPLQTIGEGLLLLPPVLFLHVFLAYPNGRLENRLEQVLVVGGYIAVFGLDLVRALVEITGPDGAANAALNAQRAAIAVVALGALVALISRQRSSGKPLRRSLQLLVVCFVLALVALAVGIVMRAFAVPGTDVFRWVAFALVGVAPILLLVGHLRARLARSAVGDLFVELRGDPGPGELQDALARALGDPTLTLAYWLPEFGVYADPEGRAVELPDSGDDQAVTSIEQDGGRVAVLLHDPALEAEPELLDAAAAAARMALENAQLNVELRARLEELRGSRARIVDATQRERQRLERNLHDGAQQRLIALALNLGLLEARVEGDGEIRAGIDQARREVTASLTELREIARGIHPAVVSGHGLAVAVEQLAARATVPVELRVEIEGRVAEALEVAAYYVVAESLTNIAKHAQASRAWIEIVKDDGELTLEVLDDGIGGADSECGTGLRGLADRVEALNGRLRVWTPRGGGTRVRAEIPCA